MLYLPPVGNIPPLTIHLDGIMGTRKYLVAGNWKMHGSMQMTEELLSGVLAGVADMSNVDVLVCPSFPYLLKAAEVISGGSVYLGAQNVSEQSQGAFTGEVSTSMVKDIGCQYVLVGHSERRELYGETDQLVAQKFAAALEQGLIPVLCVGETLDQRKSDSTEQVIAEQLDAVLNNSGVQAFAKAVIAYEPVWAIGTGETATPDQAQQVHAFIREKLSGLDAGIASKVQILYGGSVKPDNAGSLFSQPDIDGGLIGGASLKADDFVGICQAASQIS